MKKILLTLLVLGGVISAEAQKKGSLLLYGNLELNKSDIDTPSSNHLYWRATPGIGVQISDHITIGVNLAWSQDATTIGTGDPVTINEYRGGAFVRYTCRLNETFFFFDQLNGGYIGGYTTSAGNPARDETSGFYVNMFPAIGVNVTESFALNFGFGGVGYETRTVETGFNNAPTVDITTNNFNLTFGQQFHVGVSKNFGGRSSAKKAHKEEKADTEETEEEAPTRRKKVSNDDDE